MGFLSAIFGGGRSEPAPVAEPLPEPEPQMTEIDPNREAELSEAARNRQMILARRGRSSLVTSRDGETRSGVSIVT
jgi:hypothetical protein